MIYTYSLVFLLKLQQAYRKTHLVTADKMYLRLIEHHPPVTKQKQHYKHILLEKHVQ